MNPLSDQKFDTYLKMFSDISMLDSRICGKREVKKQSILIRVYLKIILNSKQ